MMRLILPFRLFISCMFLILCLIHKLTIFVCGHNQDQVFSMPESELKYLLDDEADAHITSLIRFTPQSLDLGEHSIGIPFVERVVVENTHDESNIQMISISGNTAHFHCSFFEEKIIQPKGNTTFDVVFLARQEGAVNNTLFIHTSIGSFKYQVSAKGKANPFRLRPFVGAKVPLNSSYAPLIHIYNPHSSPIQLTEIYSTGGGLHLELPNGESESSEKIWQIAPYETKIIMKANFLARSEKNHTAFIRIKTNTSDNEFVILPVEVEVTSTPGIYSPVEILDFGVLRSHDEPKTLSLYILNSGSKHIQIQNVIATPVNDALNIEFSPMRVVPDIFHPVDVAQVTLNPSKMTQCSKQCNGKIVVKSKNNQYKLAIPYQVTFLQGYLSYNETSTQFYIQQNAKTERRNLIIDNHFNFSVIIHSIFLPDDAKPHFKASLVSKQVILKPNSSEEAIKISFSPSGDLTQLETKIRIQTNISYFDVPLHAYSGKLEVFIPESFNQTVLDFGAIGLGEKKSMTFAVINNNPIVVRLKHWGCNMSKAYVELVGIGEGNASVIANKLDLSGLSRKQITLLKPRFYAIFKLHLNGFTEEGLFYGENFVETPFERLKIPFVLRAVDGDLKANKVFISNCFPGRISSQSVQLTSTFSHEMTLKSANIISQDERFTFELNHSIINFGENIVGKVYFDPIKSCGKQCYSGLDASKEVGNLWLLGLSLHGDTGYIDKELHKLLYTRYNNMKDKNLNITLQLNVDGVSPVSIDVQAQYNWPKLVVKNSMKFPITKMKNMTVKELILENPSSQPLVVQAVLLSDYPNPDAIIQLFKSDFDSKWTESELSSAETKPKSFQLVNTSSYEIAESHKQIKENLAVNVDANSVSFVLPAGIRKKISIGFTPKDDSAIATTFLLIRNNLTILDAVYLQGQGGSGILKIGNQLAGSKSILTFELADKHLKSCKSLHHPSNYAIEPTFTVHRTFTAVNVGKLAMKIRGFKIGPPGGGYSSYTCQGYGFKVINCAAFDLRPNESKKIHIAFTPDFTQSKTRQVMGILTDGPQERLEYTLLATLPKNLLQPCNDSIPRPNWEAVLYYCLVIMMSFMILLSVCVAFFDGDRILNYSFYPVLTMHATHNNFEANSLNSTPEDSADKTFSKLGPTIEDVKDAKNNNSCRQRKGSKVGSNGGKTRSGSNSYVKEENATETSVYQNQSWAQWFLAKRKLQRRDSSGSDKSNNSLKGNQNRATTSSTNNIERTNNKENESIEDKSGKLKAKNNTKQVNNKQNNENSLDKTGKKKLNTPLRYENCTNVISSPPPPLPLFPSPFDEMKKNNKKSKPVKESEVSSTLELPYKPSKSNLNAQQQTLGKQMKKAKSREERTVDDSESLTSSNENSSSLIWDSPITTFNSDSAMNELVRQTELFAEKAQSKSRSNSQSVINVKHRKHQEKDAFGNCGEFSTHQNKQIDAFANVTTWSQPNRSITPPERTSYRFEERLFPERNTRTPPTSFNSPLLDKPVSNKDWLNDLKYNASNRNVNTLDHELSHLRETSSPFSPWNSPGNSGSSNNVMPTPEKEWKIISGIESTKELWDISGSSDAPVNASPTPTSSQPLWNDNTYDDKAAWDATKIGHTSWGDIRNTNLPTLSGSGSNITTEASLFNLFGRSLWNPLSSQTSTPQTPMTPSVPVDNSINPQSEATITTSIPTATTVPADSVFSSSTWNFSPFNMFDQTNQNQSNENNQHK